MKKYTLILGIIVIILVLVGFGFLYVNKNKAPKQPTSMARLPHPVMSIILPPTREFPAQQTLISVAAAHPCQPILPA